MIRVRLRGQLQETGKTIKRIKGNAKTCIIVEPLWAIPYNLFITYASVYMVALGCTERQVGLIASIALVFQMFFSLIGGYVTDKLGRRRTSLIFDLISWSIPTLIWALAQNFYYFLIAAIINSMVRIVHTSWSCLFIEDTSPDDRVHIFTWLQVASILSGFVAPLAGLFVNKYELVPTVRVLYFIAFISMTCMFILRHVFVVETSQGLIRMEETKDESFFDSMKDYKTAAKQLIESPYMLIAFMLTVATNIHNIIRSNFLAIALTQKLGLSQGSIAIFPAIQSGIMLLIFLFVMPTVGRLHFKKPLLSSFISLLLSNLLLVLSPEQSYIVVGLSTVLMAYGTAVSYPFIESILANSINDEERAKTMSILYVILYAITAPFGYIGGVLSSVSQGLPFVLLTVIFILCIILTFVLDNINSS